MLKHRININEVKDDSVELDINDIKIIDIVNKENIVSSSKTIVCTYGSNDRFKNVNEIYGTNHYVVALNNDEENEDIIEIDNNGVYNIQGTINNLNGTFSFEIPYLYSLNIKDIRHNEEEDKKYLYFYFSKPHYFTTIKPELYGQYVNYDELYLWVYDYKGIGDIFYLIGSLDEFSDNQFLKNLGKIELLTESSFRMEYNDDYPDIEEYYVGMRFYRQNFLFSELGQNKFFFYDFKCNINVPLSTKQQINLLKEDTLNEYIKDVRKRSINKIVDMEKDIYYPVIKNGDEYETVYKIKFNFHFIRRDDNWITKTENLWNGVEIGKGEEQKLELSKDFFVYNESSEQSDLLNYLNFNNNDVRFQKNKLKKSFVRLSFYDSPNMGNQNLLSYSTIFMNGGEYFNKYIKYMEEKGYKEVEIDKDSYQEANEENEWQFDQLEYKDSLNDDSNEDQQEIENDGLTGIRVNREYKEGDEEKRLSSQITVTDKYNSDASSEGFYLYLWRDILPIIDEETLKKGTQTIYMKVEFNHAGYGRVIPFMMPYWDIEKWKKNREIMYSKTILEEGKDNKNISYKIKFLDKEEKIENNEIIKTFEEIVQDWDKTYKDGSSNSYKEVEENEEDNKEFTLSTDGQYGAKQYIKFSYIKIKIGYDESQKKYIYYLDDSVYGTPKMKEENTLTFNLYEAKMI